MALVPIRCPSCGASVDLEEGQTIVRCSYCQSTSYLPTPAAQPPPPAVQQRPAPPARSSSWTTVVVLALVVLPLMGGLAFFLMKGGVGADYLKDATSVQSVLADGLGSKTRFVTMTLSGRHTYVEVLEDDGTIVVHRFDGASARDPSASGKVDDIAQARKGAFKLEDVDFSVVSKIVKHAQKQAPKGEPLHAIFGRRLPHQADLLWTIGMKVAGEHRSFLYTPAGKPVVDEPIDFIAAFEKAALPRFEKRLPAKARLVKLDLAREYARVVVMAPKNPRDTDVYSFSADGIVSAAVPETSDGDAKALAAQVFTLRDVDAAALARAVADATQHLEAQVHQVIIFRIQGALSFQMHAKSDRGASRSARYDASGKRQPD